MKNINSLCRPFCLLICLLFASTLSYAEVSAEEYLDSVEIHQAYQIINSEGVNAKSIFFIKDSTHPILVLDSQKQCFVVSGEELDICTESETDLALHLDKLKRSKQHIMKGLAVGSFAAGWATAGSALFATNPFLTGLATVYYVTSAGLLYMSY